MMRRRDFLKTTSAAALASGACSAGARPNIVFILTDQQHIDTIA
ncbi:MAG: twin-arginine translocation signal domain-containing protein, partial [bacterium]|nr:twin-arginine translocation signal domain-containing protein [bacterium]